MLYLILFYFGITCICLWAGILVYSCIDRERTSERSLVHYLITGLILITVMGQWIVLFFPIRFYSLLFILCLVLLLTGIRRERMIILFKRCFAAGEKNILFIGSLFFLGLMILVLNAGPFMMDDTDSYHIQMVKWIQEYGSVPGIANLHLRFGFNSSWFVSIALFCFPGFGLNSYGTLNGLLSAWLCFYLLENIILSIKGNPAKSNAFSIACMVLFFLCLLNWPMIRGSAASTNYDFISTCCIIILFVDLSVGQKEMPAEWLLWPAYLCSVRLMNFPLLILSLLYLFQFFKTGSYRKVFLGFFAAGFIIIPFLTRNIIISGYPFFPVYQLDLFSFDWKADKMKLMEISRYIKYFNRVNPMFQSLAVTEKLGFPNWGMSWYTHLFRFDRLILTLSSFGYLILILRLKQTRNHLYRIFLAVMICQLILWFFVGPDPRFAYGPLLFGIFAAITGFTFLKDTWSGFMRYSLILTSSFVFTYTLLKIIRDPGYRNFLTPHPIPVPAVRTIVIDHIQMHIPERILNNWNPRCYDIELPCLYRMDPRLEARGEKISDGFRLKNGIMSTDGEYKITE